MPKLSKIKYLSLFSGCGGFDLGFSAEGFECLGAFDSDPAAVETYNRNHRWGARCQQLDLSEWRHELDSFVSKVDVVIAGPPCQGFSVAGLRKLNDPRNHLLLRAAEIAVRLKPSVIAIENVMAIRSGRHKVYWRKAISHLEVHGYSTMEVTLDCSRMGVPQMRRRVVLLASRKKPVAEWKLELSSVAVLRNALKRLPRDSSHRPAPLKKGNPMLRIIRRIGPGQQLSNARNGTRSVHTWDIPEVYGAVTAREKTLLKSMLVLRRRLRRRERGDADPLSASSISRHIGRPVTDLLAALIRKGYVRRIGRHYDLCNTFNGKFRRLSWDRPSYTVDTKFGEARCFLHPVEHRGLTVREAARIQGFPDRFSYPLGAEDAYRLIGNAVPPPAAARLAAAIRRRYFAPHA